MTVWRTTKAKIGTWFGFVLMCLGMFMAILDIQVVATSLPTIQKDLAISPDAMSWIQTAYLIAETIAIPLTGWLTRVLTLRWLFVVAISVFTLTSVGCAFSGNFLSLVTFRVLQGFSGGTLIPAVFSGIFLLFPARAHPIAGSIAGIMAVLGPTVGPVIGGWITYHYSWPWLFLVNVIPGVVAAVATPFLLPRGRPRLNQLKYFDVLSLTAMAVALASLEIALKQAPRYGWFSGFCVGLFALVAVTTALFAVRTLRVTQPVVELRTLTVRPFAIGCVLSFCLGVGLFGAVYLMPVFLAYVRQHDALQIGSIMLVTGAAQLVAAPIAGALESRLNSRWLSAFGFGLFAIGLGWSAFESRVADYDEMFWPQILRGFAAMFCLLPPTRLALEMLPHKQVPDASGLFNMMRNLGGAVGIALIDTILYGRTDGHAEALRQRLAAGDVTIAGIGPDDIDRFAFAASANESWGMLAAVALIGLLLIPFANGRAEPGTERMA
jgi:DHA2 family multidrug resistance protein